MYIHVSMQYMSSKTEIILAAYLIDHKYQISPLMQVVLGRLEHHVKTVHQFHRMKWCYVYYLKYQCANQGTRHYTNNLGVNHRHSCRLRYSRPSTADVGGRHTVSNCSRQGLVDPNHDGSLWHSPYLPEYQNEGGTLHRRWQ